MPFVKTERGKEFKELCALEKSLSKVMRKMNLGLSNRITAK